VGECIKEMIKYYIRRDKLINRKESIGPRGWPYTLLNSQNALGEGVHPLFMFGPIGYLRM
jgi:hypothetical protein